MDAISGRRWSPVRTGCGTPGTRQPNKRVSGTYASAQSGAALAPHPRMENFDGQSAHLGMGMMTLNAARLASRGDPPEEILSWLARWREDSGMAIALKTLACLRRGGRTGAAKCLIGGLLGLRPITPDKDEKTLPVANARSDAEAYERAIALLKSQIRPGKRVRLGLVEMETGGAMDRAENELTISFDVIELFRARATGVVGAHAGPGALGVFCQRVRDGDPLD